MRDETVAEFAALRARVAELEAMNKMLCGKLDDQRRALWDPCAPYLKDGETPAACIFRNRRDVAIALSSLVRERMRVMELEAAIERWKVEELRQLQCQCAKPRAFLLGDVPWCEACDKPREWGDAAKGLRPDELALIERAIPSAGGGL